MFASELASRCGVAGDQASALLRRLESRGLVVVVDHPAPDPCLAEADLRVAAAIEGDDDEEARRAAVERAESLWSSWLGRFLGSHRCL
jgi:NAD-dependent oxidoreductase involved in siderophore biosynthesis